MPTDAEPLDSVCLWLLCATSRDARPWCLTLAAAPQPFPFPSIDLASVFSPERSDHESRKAKLKAQLTCHTNWETESKKGEGTCLRAHR